MAEKKKIRIGLGSFDLIKGIAILSVIVFHSYNSHPGWELLYTKPTFMLWNPFLWSLMPMFLIISGYGFKKKPIKKMLKKTFSELIIPYLIAIPIAIFLHYILCCKIYPNAEYRANVIEKKVITFLLGTDSSGPLWFFLALFIANNLLNLILMLKKESIQILLVGLCVFAGFAVMHFEFRYFRIIEGLTAVGYCYVGFFLKTKKILEKAAYSIWSYVVLIPMWFFQFLELINGGSGFNMASADFTFLSYFLAGCVGLLLILVGLQLDRIQWDWLEFIRKCGMYSYWILIVHTIEFLAFPWWDLWDSNPSMLLAFAIEWGLRVLVLSMGCDILRKVTQKKYKNRIGI